MFKVVKDHPKVFWAIIILIILVSILSVYEKQKYKANPYENQIGNPPREDKVFNDKLDIENPIIRINTAFKGCSSLEKISVLPRIYHN